MNTSIQLIDPSFQTQHSGKCDLLLEILPSAIQFAVVDKGQDQLKVLYRMEDFSVDAVNFKELTELAPTLQHHYRKVKVGIKSTKFTLIPEDLFDKSLLGEYAKFISNDEDDLILYNHIRSAKCMVVFTLPSKIIHLLRTQFHEPQFFHAAATNIEAGMKWAKVNDDTLFMLHLTESHLECTCFKEGKLTFFNIFPSRNADEFNYFLLNLINQLDFEMENTSWLLAGKWHQAYLNRLEKYSQQIIHNEESTFVKIEPPFDQLERPPFFSLTALSLCE